MLIMGISTVPLRGGQRHGYGEDKIVDEVQKPVLVSRFPEFCASAVRVPVSGSNTGCPPSLRYLFIGLSASKLHIALSPLLDFSSNINEPSKLFPPTHTLSHACTSYAIAGPYLVWTATAPAHEALFVRLDVLYDVMHSPDKRNIEDTLEKRRIERGARIVTVVPSTMSLVLQMPRGNLETVMPRPLVMEKVRADVQRYEGTYLDSSFRLLHVVDWLWIRKEYRAAFLACRKHRVDLNILVEINPTGFVENIASFVEQLDDVDHINLFLSGLGCVMLFNFIRVFYGSMLIALQSIVPTSPDNQSALRRHSRRAREVQR